METFKGYHSEWNLGSPGGWDYQRIAQKIGKEVWENINRINPIGVDLDFDHPLLYPIYGFVEMLLAAYRSREGSNSGMIAVVAEEETLEDVTENINLANRLNSIEGISSALMAPHHLELAEGIVCHQGRPISIIFMDFNTDVLLSLHHKHGLAPLLQAVKEGRVINPRGTEPINVKSMFEVLTSTYRSRFDPEVVSRTPWTRQFYSRKTEGPAGERIEDLIEWTRAHWKNLVLKPERGYSGMGVKVGGINKEADECIELALQKGDYIVQEKIPPNLWAEDVPDLDKEKESVSLVRYQTDFRCLFGPQIQFGFLGRYGGIPTNVGSGGGCQPLAVLRSELSVGKAVKRINDGIMQIGYDALAEVADKRDKRAIEHKFTYLLGPIKIALRPRVLTDSQLESLGRYCSALWSDCLTLEKMWLAGELDHIIKIDEEELEIARSQPWGGSPAIIASDGLFSFGAEPEMA